MGPSQYSTSQNFEICYRPLPEVATEAGFHLVRPSCSSPHCIVARDIGGWGPPSPPLQTPLPLRVRLYQLPPYPLPIFEYIFWRGASFIGKRWKPQAYNNNSLTNGCKGGESILECQEEIQGRGINSLKIITRSWSLPPNRSESKCYDGAKTPMHCFICFQHVVCCHLSKFCNCGRGLSTL